MVTLLLLTACVTTQPQPDGSTKVRISLGDSTKATQNEAQTTSTAPNKPVATVDETKATSSKAVMPPSIRSTAMAGLFAKHPYDGTTKTHFPRAAVTVTDWSHNDCWSATATIWWNKSKSESVSPFSVCWGQSVGYAVNNAANLHLFMQQTAFEHSGNVRSTGPKPPMLAIPDRQPINERQQLAFQGFLQQLVLDTGWKPGAPTNLWLVGYNPNAGVAIQAENKVTQPTAKPMGGKAKQLLEQALSCTTIGKSFETAEIALKQAGWNPDQDITQVNLPQPLTVYGLSSRKIVVFRDGFEHTYRSYLPGISLQQVIKASSLKLGKDGKTYGRVTKLGVLSADIENGETTLTCTVDVEG